MEGTLQEYLGKLIIFTSILLRMRIVSDIVVEKNQNTCYVRKLFQWKVCCLWDNMEKKRKNIMPCWVSTVIMVTRERHRVTSYVLCLSVSSLDDSVEWYNCLCITKSTDIPRPHYRGPVCVCVCVYIYIYIYIYLALKTHKILISV